MAQLYAPTLEFHLHINRGTYARIYLSSYWLCTSKFSTSHVLKQVRQSCPHLFAAGYDLGRGQDETIVSCVAQLNRHRVLDLGIFVGVVDRSSRDLVDGGANRTLCESCAMDSFDSSDCTL